MISGSTGRDLRAARESAHLAQEHVAAVLGVAISRLRSIERMDLVDTFTVAQYQRALAVLVGLRRQAGRRVVQAARMAAEI